MKVTKRQLKQIIKEELEAALEGFSMPDQAKDITRGQGNKPDKTRRCKILKSHLDGLDPHAGIGDRDANRAMEAGLRMQAEREWDDLECDKVLGTAAE